MRAFHIMLFLMLFNLCVTLVGSLNIYPTYVSTDSQYAVDNPNPDNSALYRFGGSLLIGSIGGIMAGSLISYFTKLPAAAAVAYGLFAGSFWFFMTDAFAILWRIGNGNLGISTVVTIFGLIAGLIFLGAMMQMVSGGWRGIE